MGRTVVLVGTMGRRRERGGRCHSNSGAVNAVRSRTCGRCARRCARTARPRRARRGDRRRRGADRAQAVRGRRSRAVRTTPVRRKLDVKDPILFEDGEHFVCPRAASEHISCTISRTAGTRSRSRSRTVHAVRRVPHQRDRRHRPRHVRATASTATADARAQEAASLTSASAT